MPTTNIYVRSKRYQGDAPGNGIRISGQQPMMKNERSKLQRKPKKNTFNIETEQHTEQTQQTPKTKVTPPDGVAVISGAGIISTGVSNENQK